MRMVTVVGLAQPPLGSVNLVARGAVCVCVFVYVWGVGRGGRGVECRVERSGSGAWGGAAIAA